MTVFLLRKFGATFSMQPATMSPDAYDAFLRAEAQRNERIIKSLKLKIE